MERQELYHKVTQWFEANMETAETELHYDSPFHLLIAVILLSLLPAIPITTQAAARGLTMEEMMEKTFEGSLPAFIAAFTKHQKISDAEIDAIQQMIDRFRKGESQ